MQNLPLRCPAIIDPRVQQEEEEEGEEEQEEEEEKEEDEEEDIYGTRILTIW